MISEPIYKRDTAGKIRTWQYEVSEELKSYRTIAGIQGGSLVTSGWTRCVGKNAGRANATTDEQQAAFEAEAEMGKKLKREYRRTIEELDSVGVGPMLAHDYAKLKKPLDFSAPRDGIYSQPKLDGIRAIITRHGAFSRELQPHHNCEHIIEALAPVFAVYPDLIFDGEFYNHDLKDDFNKIVSVVRKQNPDAKKRAEAAKLIQYHVYDLPSDAIFSERCARLHLLFTSILAENPYVKAVETATSFSQEDLDYNYARWIEQGYEGQMVRLDAPYDFDARSKSLLKRKEFKTAEFKFLRAEEGLGNWAGYAKRIVVQLPNGQECGAGLRGTQEFAKKLLEEQGKYKFTTLRYFGETPDGSLRFPVAIDFHGAEGRVD